MFEHMIFKKRTSTLERLGLLGAFLCSLGALGCQLVDTKVKGEFASSGPFESVQFQTFSPASPSSMTNVKIQGAAPQGTSDIHFFSNSSCETAIGSGDAAGFEGLGIALNLTGNQLNTIYAITTSEKGAQSACTLMGNYLSDSTPPDSPLSVEDLIAWPDLATSPPLTWQGGDTDNLSGFDHYEYSVGTLAGQTDVISWTSNGSSSTLSLSGLSLTLNTDYFVNVRSVDMAGNASAVMSSDGWKTVTVVTVVAAQASAPDWNDFYQKASPSTPCNGSESLQNCIHGAERKAVDVPTETSCTNLSAQDQLDAFVWFCDDSGANVVFYSRQLKESAGLRELVNASSWKDNQVIISKSGVPTYASSSSAWWSNPVEPLVDNSSGTVELLSDAGKIYTLSESRSSMGYNINADKVAIVTLGDSVLSYSGDGSINNCKKTSGEVTSPDSICLISVGNQKLIWIETFTDAFGTWNGINLSLSSFIILRRGGISFGSYNLNMYVVNNLIASQYRFTKGGQKAIYYSSSSNIYFDRINIGNQSVGIDTGNPSYKMVISQSVFHNISSGAINPYSGSRDVWNGITAVQTGSLVIDGSTSAAGIVNQLVMDQSVKLRVSLVDNYTFSQIAITNSSIAGIQFLSNANNNKFTGNLLLGNTTNCSYSSSPTSGLTGADCDNEGVSDAIRQLGIDVSGSFVGPVGANDSVNQSDDNSGTAIANTITDWFGFLTHPFRGWGSAIVNFSCSGTNTCAIWDFRLKASDTVIFNKSFDATNDNDPFVAGATCPNAVDGNVVAVDQNAVTTTYLLNAVEIYRDGIGNDNAICESNEACIYMPNFGAYQGEGDFYANGSCNFQNGAISGITMYAYPINGVP